MHITQKQTVIGVVLLVALAYGSGYGVSSLKIGALQHDLEGAVLDNRVMEKQMKDMQEQKNVISSELTKLKDRSAVSLIPPPHVLEAINQRGIVAEQLLADLKRHPEVIPTAAVLGGTMGFTQVGIVNQRWVYGAYEDGHIAGAAIFQWEAKDSGIAWTPVLVLKD